MDKKKNSDKKTKSRQRNAVPDGPEMMEEQKAHQEHLRRLRKYKKKHKQQVVGLVLELVLLVIVIGGFLAISWTERVIHRIQVTTEASTPVQTLDVRQPEDPSGEPVPVETTPVQVSWMETDGSIHTGTMPPQEPYTNPLKRRDVEAREGYMTIACFGVDARNTTDLLRNAQGDVVIIISINLKNGEVRMSSIYRDFLFEFSSGQFAKMADVYNRYGADQVVGGLNRNFDLNITNFLVVNWAALADVVDLLGGIDIEVTEAEAIELDQYVWETMEGTGRDVTEKITYEGGMKHLDGVHTVCYCRIRYNVGSDFARTERQRKVIGVLLDKMKDLAKNLQFGKLMTIIEKVSLNIKTNLDTSEIVDLVLDAGKFSITETSGFPYNRYEDLSDQYMLASSSYTEDVKALHKFLYQYEEYEPSDNVKRIESIHNNFIETGYYPGKGDW